MFSGNVDKTDFSKASLHLSNFPPKLLQLWIFHGVLTVELPRNKFTVKMTNRLYCANFNGKMQSRQQRFIFCLIVGSNSDKTRISLDDFTLLI